MPVQRALQPGTPIRWPPVTGRGVVKGGGDTWFFLTADYAFGQALEKDTSDVIKAENGKVLGSGAPSAERTQDFSSFMLQAQASKAKVVGLANAGGDTINAIKSANEFGITKNTEAGRPAGVRQRRARARPRRPPRACC